MLMLSIFQFDPAMRDAVVRKRLELGPPLKPGVKLIGQWSHVGGGKVFTLLDAEDPTVTYDLMVPYSNLGKFEVFPLMETEAVLEVLKRQQKTVPVGV